MEEAPDGVGDVEHATHHGHHKEHVDHGWDPGQQGKVEEGDGAGRGWRHEDLKQLLQVSNLVALMRWATADEVASDALLRYSTHDRVPLSYMN